MSLKEDSDDAETGNKLNWLKMILTQLARRKSWERVCHALLWDYRLGTCSKSFKFLFIYNDDLCPKQGGQTTLWNLGARTSTGLPPASLYAYWTKPAATILDSLWTYCQACSIENGGLQQQQRNCEIADLVRQNVLIPLIAYLGLSDTSLIPFLITIIIKRHVVKGPAAQPYLLYVASATDMMGGCR